MGRDLEILKIEKALLRHNVLLLQGMGGTGKTTLLNYLRDWWQRTNFTTEVFYFGYDEKAHTLQQILQAIGKRVYSKFEFASFQAMGLGAQRRKLAEMLRARPYGIVLDNLESVTGEALAIQNTLSEAEQAEIKTFLQALGGGQTKVVLGSRSDEAWLQPVFCYAGKGNRYRLRGLDVEARTVLAEKVLAETSLSQREIARLQEENDFERLMGLLAGYPLVMEVVLANLGRQSAADVLAGLDAADVNLDSGEVDRTKSILKCVEYSHSNLSVAAQKLLLCLAPFKGFIDRADLANYAKQLQQLEPFADWAFDKFEDAVDEAMRWGLLSPYSERNDEQLRIQPVFPYFLKAKLATMDEAVPEGLVTGFKEHYKELAVQYQQMMQSKEPEQRKLGLFFCELEYENLFSALQTCLKRQNAYLKTQQYLPARTAYQNTLNLLKELNVIGSTQKGLYTASTMHQLGRVAQGLREFEKAWSHYQTAFNIRIEFGERDSLAGTYHQIGSLYK